MAYIKSRISRNRLTNLSIGVSLIVFIIFVLSSFKEDSDTEELNIKLQNLYNPKNQAPPKSPIKEAIEDIRNSRSKAKNIVTSDTGKCINYVDYSQQIHGPLSEGELQLPYQRPPERCRTYKSNTVERVLSDLKQRVKNPDLFRLIENALPNTLDTAILWSQVKEEPYSAFISTGDIHSEWLRDTARQLSIYQKLTPYEDSLKKLLKGAIHTQSSFVTIAPYCNAFHPPPGSGVKKGDGAIDKVNPRPPWKHVFECKYEIDSLASFLTLSREYYENTQDYEIFDIEWLNALANILTVIRRESSPTFDENGNVLPFYYSFQRNTDIGTETLPLAGTGNPVNFGIGLVRSAFRPSDDACIFQFFIPGNAHLQVELEKIYKIMKSVEHKIPTFDNQLPKMLDDVNNYAKLIKESIYKHAVIEHPEFGKVFAFEIDGYGGAVFMDDANIPSLLSLPDLGFLEKTDAIYQNTRKMILSKRGNPYFLEGKYFKGIGGPHIGIHSAWPMSLLVQIRTSDNETEILESLDLVLKNTGDLGLIHESVNVASPGGYDYTRPWFSWANSEFGKTILDLAKRKPHLIFKDEYKKIPYDIENLKF
ncbi:hypothetical protein WICMUC_001473 [Wickerhamomyces mucosus]|uniref:Glycoside hydrolase family 125 protein n=1 Tax=Wickerhamomyces mucosus TaxID=1378264 RepID=A0A9P8THE3_9ASCO|nr:hypothetical protein WICMUC_001473 [Wickerhamomyces mucosus]